MEISASKIKELRDKTNAGFIDCKEALKESKGDFEKAIEILRKKGQVVAMKKTGRATNAGMIETYIHPGSRLGVMVEINCETDFVARNEIFKQFCKEVAMQIAALRALYVSREEVPAAVIEKEKEIYADQVKGKPQNVVDKILDGKLEKFYADVCLVDQPCIKDDKKKVSDMLTQKIHELGENIVIKRFVRYEVGE